MYGEDIIGTMPCPLDLLLSIIHLTQLRRDQVGMAADALPSAIRTEFEVVLAFDSNCWAAKSERNSNKALALAEIFRTSVLLYGILALPRQAVTTAWAALPPPPGASSRVTYSRLRKTHAQALLWLLQNIWPTLEYPPVLVWPLIVAGVAVAADKGPENQDFVGSCLFAIWKTPNESNTFLALLEKLRRLWQSGKTEWEDCFNDSSLCAM